MRRTTCSACGYDGLEPFLNLGLCPVADAYTYAPDDEPPRYPLELAVCAGCRLVQLLDVLPQELLFGTGYSFYSSASPPLSAYHARYAADLLRAHRSLAERGVIEIGCNDGDFLRHFTHLPHLGVDPAAGPVATARLRGLTVRCEPFSYKLAREVSDDDRWRDGAGVVVANHVMAHVESVADVFEGIRRVLAADGVAFVEVQYLADMLVNNAFDLVYHEHRNFFSLSSLAEAAGQFGLAVDDWWHTSRQGGSIRVRLRRREYARGAGLAANEAAHEDWLRDVCTYRGFQGRVDRIVSRLRSAVWSRPGPVIGYGAPAKATTLLNTCGLTSADLAFVTDTTPAKQGRHIPGTGIPIRAPGDRWPEADGRAVLILAWNYAREVMRQHPDYHGDWIVPIPAPVIL